MAGPRTPKTAAATADGAEPKPERQEGVQVLARAGEILRLLKVSAGGLTQAEMATRLGLARTTVHRIMNALADEGLVQLSGAGSRYRLGTEILQMADAARTALVSEAHPLLRQLSEELQETVDLSVLDRGHVTFVDQVVSAQRLRAVSAVGASFPLHCTANGKAILAALPPADARRLLREDLEVMTANTITSRDALMDHLQAIGARGVAFDLEEHSLGICAIGAAVGDTPIGPAAVSVPIPVQRFEEKRADAVKAIQRTVRAIEAIFSR